MRLIGTVERSGLPTYLETYGTRFLNETAIALSKIGFDAEADMVLATFHLVKHLPIEDFLDDLDSTLWDQLDTLARNVRTSDIQSENTRLIHYVRLNSSDILRPERGLDVLN